MQIILKQFLDDTSQKMSTPPLCEKKRKKKRYVTVTEITLGQPRSCSTVSQSQTAESVTSRNHNQWVPVTRTDLTAQGGVTSYLIDTKFSVY